MKTEELILLIDLLDKLGYNTETAGTGTAFQRLAQIADYVDTLETKLGLNTDAAGTGTVFARLAQIAGYTDQVEGFVDTLESNLGTTGDAANASGTVLARLAELLTNRLTAARAGYLDATISSRAAAAAVNALIGNSVYFPMLSQVSAVTDTWYTVCSVSGSGILHRAAAHTGDAQGRNTSSLRITIDGVASAEMKASDTYIYCSSFGSAHLDWVGNTKFDSSLLVEIKQTSGSTVKLDGAANYSLL